MMMDPKKRLEAKKIPYGLSAYGDIRRENYYYVDKTMYLDTIENYGKFLFFIRPRRFGKSLFITMMSAYYDVYYKDRFEEFFKGTWIYDHPTENKNSHLIFSLNFSIIAPNLKTIEFSFLEYIRKEARRFMNKYRDIISSSVDTSFYRKDIEESRSANDIIFSLINLCREANQKLYVIIDEYDHFTNNILVADGRQAYLTLTHDTGFVRAFFNALKMGTTDIEAPLSRLFISGVSPVTMDDLTSGFNIGLNISIEPSFNSTLGFTRRDLVEMIDHYRSTGKISHSTDFLLDIMTEWYGNYIFSKKAETALFNSDMVLYFMFHYMKVGEIPDDLIDTNVRTDYSKLRHLIIIDRDAYKTVNGNFNMLKEIISEGSTWGTLIKSFPLEKILNPNHFKSLLFYFGLLTINGTDARQLRLEIPNETIRSLYYTYIEEAYDETGIFSLDISQFNRLMSGMAFKGDWLPLFEYLFTRMKESMSLRDLINGEKAVQAFLNVYLGLSSLYIIHPERELNKGYADLFMEPFIARYEGIQYAYLLEIKYLKAGYKADDPEVLRLKTEAETQIQKYSVDEKLKKCLEKVTLVQLIVIFSGHEAIYYKALH